MQNLSNKKKVREKSAHNTGPDNLDVFVVLSMQKRLSIHRRGDDVIKVALRVFGFHGCAHVKWVFAPRITHFSGVEPH